MSAFSRLSRTKLVRSFMVTLMVLVACVRPFGGATVVAHDHHDADPHLHVSSSHTCADHPADSHPHAPAHTHATDPITNEEPDGLLLSIPLHDQTLTRGIDLSTLITIAEVIVPAAWILMPAPHSALQDDPPADRVGSIPRHVCALHAGERIMRTSRALLI